MLVMAGLTLSTASRSGFLSLGLVFMFLLFQKGVVLAVPGQRHRRDDGLRARSSFSCCRARRTSGS